MKNYLGLLSDEQLIENEKMVQEENLEPKVYELDDLRYLAEKALRAIPNGLDDEGDGEDWSSPARTPLAKLILMIESMKIIEKEKMTQEQEMPIINFGEINVKSGDILVMHIEVGRMPPQRIQEYIKRIKTHLNERMVQPLNEKGIEIVFSPMRDCVPTLMFSSIRQDDNASEEETKIVSVSAELTEAINEVNG